MLPWVRSSFRCRSAQGKQSPAVIAFQSIWPASIFSRVKPNIFRNASFASKIRRREPVSTPRCSEARRNARESLTVGLGWLGHMNEGSPIGASPALAPYIFLAYTRYSPGSRFPQKDCYLRSGQLPRCNLAPNKDALKSRTRRDSPPSRLRSRPLGLARNVVRWRDRMRKSTLLKALLAVTAPVTLVCATAFAQ